MLRIYKFFKHYFKLDECYHIWVLAIPDKDVKIGGNVPYVCSLCNAKYVVPPKRRGT